MNEKTKGLTVNLILYIAALGIGAVPFALIGPPLLAEAALTFTATLVIYTVTCFVPDTSLYDPYWSVAPPYMLAAAAVKYGFKGANAAVMLVAVIIWSLRLTANWAITYKGLCREDWRYRMYREKCGKFGFALVNLFGLQLVPTAVVYAGSVGAFYVMLSEGFEPLMLIGVAVMLSGVAFEFASDRAIHRFLRENAGTCRCCDVSLWKYSRHPNYLGEITFWVGVFLAFAAVRPDIWYRGLGVLAVVFLFLFVSIPMMEKHNEKKREGYAEYKNATSPLLLLPPKKRK